jgi:hypothetical protein
MCERFASVSASRSHRSISFISAAEGATLQGCRQVHLAASFPKRADIVLPVRFVKIGGQKETGFIQKHWIDAHDENAAIVVLTPKMPPNRVVS